MSNIFNPAEFEESNQEQEQEQQATKNVNSEFPITGNRARDQFRKMLFEMFKDDIPRGSKDQLKIAGEIVENIESLVFQESNENARDKIYHGKSRKITQKLKGSRMAETRNQLISGQLEPSTFVTEEYLSGQAEKPQAQTSSVAGRGPGSSMGRGRIVKAPAGQHVPSSRGGRVTPTPGRGRGVRGPMPRPLAVPKQDFKAAQAVEVQEESPKLQNEKKADEGKLEEHVSDNQNVVAQNTIQDQSQEPQQQPIGLADPFAQPQVQVQIAQSQKPPQIEKIPEPQPQQEVPQVPVEEPKQPEFQISASLEDSQETEQPVQIQQKKKSKKVKKVKKPKRQPSSVECGLPQAVENVQQPEAQNIQQQFQEQQRPVEVLETKPQEVEPVIQKPQYLSQETMNQIFSFKLRQAPIYYKHGVVFAVQLQESRHIVTSFNNEIESEIDAQPGDYLIYPSHNPDGYYPCKREDFLARYTLVDNQLPQNAPPHVVRDQCSVWKATGSVQALQMTAEDINLIPGNHFYIQWGVPMRINQGDYLCEVMPYYDQPALYRIERGEFLATYSTEKPQEQVAQEEASHIQSQQVMQNAPIANIQTFDQQDLVRDRAAQQSEQEVQDSVAASSKSTPKRASLKTEDVQHMSQFDGGRPASPPIEDDKVTQEREVEVQVAQVDDTRSRSSRFSGGYTRLPSQPQVELTKLELDLQLRNKKVQLCQDENKQLREELRRAQVQVRKLEENQETNAVLVENQQQRLQATIGLKEQALAKMSKDMGALSQEKEQAQKRLTEVMNESKNYRDQFEQILKQVHQQAQQRQPLRMDNFGGYQQQINHVNDTGSVGGAGQQNKQLADGSAQPSLGASNQQELHKEMQLMRLDYERQLRNKDIELQQKNQELQRVIKDLQRVERANISLSERSKQLSDTLADMQVQNLSTVAGSGSQSRDARYQHIGNMHNNHQSYTNQQIGNVNSQSLDGMAAMDSAHSGNLAPSDLQFSHQNMIDREENPRGDGGSNYFQSITQDEGTGGESYNQQNSGASQQIMNHYNLSSNPSQSMMQRERGIRVRNRPNGLMMNQSNGEQQAASSQPQVLFNRFNNANNASAPYEDDEQESEEYDEFYGGEQSQAPQQMHFNQQRNQQDDGMAPVTVVPQVSNRIENGSQRAVQHDKARSEEDDDEDYTNQRVMFPNDYMGQMQTRESGNVQSSSGLGQGHHRENADEVQPMDFHRQHPRIVDVDHGSTSHLYMGHQEEDQASDDLEGSQAGENKEAEFGGPQVDDSLREGLRGKQNNLVDGGQPKIPGSMPGEQEGADHGEERSHGGEEAQSAEGDEGQRAAAEQDNDEEEDVINDKHFEGEHPWSAQQESGHQHSHPQQRHTQDLCGGGNWNYQGSRSSCGDDDDVDGQSDGQADALSQQQLITLQAENGLQEGSHAAAVGCGVAPYNEEEEAGEGLPNSPRSLQQVNKDNSLQIEEEEKTGGVEGKAFEVNPYLGNMDYKIMPQDQFGEQQFLGENEEDCLGDEDPENAMVAAVMANSEGKQQTTFGSKNAAAVVNQYEQEEEKSNFAGGQNQQFNASQQRMQAHSAASHVVQAPPNQQLGMQNPNQKHTNSAIPRVINNGHGATDFRNRSGQSQGGGGLAYNQVSQLEAGDSVQQNHQISSQNPSSNGGGAPAAGVSQAVLDNNAAQEEGGGSSSMPQTSSGSQKGTPAAAATQVRSGLGPSANNNKMIQSQAQGSQGSASASQAQRNPRRGYKQQNQLQNLHTNKQRTTTTGGGVSTGHSAAANNQRRPNQPQLSSSQTRGQGNAGVSSAQNLPPRGVRGTQRTYPPQQINNETSQPSATQQQIGGGSSISQQAAQPAMSGGMMPGSSSNLPGSRQGGFNHQGVTENSSSAVVNGVLGSQGSNPQNSSSAMSGSGGLGMPRVNQENADRGGVSSNSIQPSSRQKMPASHASSSANNRSSQGRYDGLSGAVHTAERSMQVAQQVSGGQGAQVSHNPGEGVSGSSGMLAESMGGGGNLHNHYSQMDRQQLGRPSGLTTNDSAESGSTAAFTNRAGSRQEMNHHISSAPSSSQTGGGVGGSNTTPPWQQNHATVPSSSLATNSAADGSTSQFQQDSSVAQNDGIASRGGASETMGSGSDFLIGAVGAPPSHSNMQNREKQHSSGGGSSMQRGTGLPSHGSSLRNNYANHQSAASQQQAFTQNYHNIPQYGNQPPHAIGGSSGEPDESASMLTANVLFNAGSSQQQQSQQDQSRTAAVSSHQEQQQMRRSCSPPNNSFYNNESRKTSGANTPSKDGADTPPYRRDQTMMNPASSSQQQYTIHNLTSNARLLLLQDQQQRSQEEGTSGRQHSTRSSNPTVRNHLQQEASSGGGNQGAAEITTGGSNQTASSGHQRRVSGGQGGEHSNQIVQAAASITNSGSASQLSQPSQQRADVIPKNMFD